MTTERQPGIPCLKCKGTGRCLGCKYPKPCKWCKGTGLEPTVTLYVIEARLLYDLVVTVEDRTDDEEVAIRALARQLRRGWNVSTY